MQRYAQICTDFSLTADAQIRSLSKGMRAKTALALAMLLIPMCLCWMNPHRDSTRKSAALFWKAWWIARPLGQTVFLSSHQIHEVERVADWVAILHAGKLQWSRRLRISRAKSASLLYRCATRYSHASSLRPIANTASDIGRPQHAFDGAADEREVSIESRTGQQRI